MCKWKLFLDYAAVRIQVMEVVVLHQSCVVDHVFDYVFIYLYIPSIFNIFQCICLS